MPGVLMQREECMVNRLTLLTRTALGLEDYITTLLPLPQEALADPLCQAETVLWVVALEIMAVLAQLSHPRLLKVLVVVHLGDPMMHSVVDLHTKVKISNTMVQTKPLKLVQVMI